MVVFNDNALITYLTGFLILFFVRVYSLHGLVYVKLMTIETYTVFDINSQYNS